MPLRIFKERGHKADKDNIFGRLSDKDHLAKRKAIDAEADREGEIVRDALSHPPLGQDFYGR